MRVLGESEGGESEGGRGREPPPAEFVFQYSIVVSLMLLTVMIIIYVAASYYHAQMLKAVLEQVGVSGKKRMEEQYIEVLKMMAEEEDEARSSDAKILDSLASSAAVEELSVLPGQGGMARVSQCHAWLRRGRGW